MYLAEKSLIQLFQGMEGSFSAFKIYPGGIDTVENEKKFELTFGINLGFVNINWRKKPNKKENKGKPFQ